MTRRRKGPFLSGVAVVLVVTAAVVAWLGVVGSDGAETRVPSDRPLVTTPITRQTLSEVTSVDGELGYGATTPVVAKAAGTVTWLPQVGARLGRGSQLARVNDRPVVLLFGNLPMYRDLGVDSEGTDVLQFERNLRALGYQGFTVDRRFTDATARAVKLWQRSLELDETGRVTVAQVVYAAGGLRVAERKVLLGAEAAGEILTASGSTRVVTADVPVAEGAWAVKGARVRVVLPGGRSVAGTVASIGTEASSPQSSGGGGGSGSGGQSGPQGATVRVLITLMDLRKVGRLERGPVQIRYTVSTRKNVLTVPVTALLALAEGGYGLEVADGARTSVLAVQTGLVADGRVEVRGAGIRVGQRVGIPG